MMKDTLKRGFTLIELLVVIAIIGILASVVLVSLNSARDKANDGSATASMSSIRAAAEIMYDDNLASYDTVCDSGTEVDVLGQAAASANGGTFTCNDTATAYAAQITLTSGNYFCVDSTGNAQQSASDKGTATVCP